MSGMLSKAIKANILTGTFKYKNDQEKIGEVLEADKENNNYVVYLINRDGIASTIYNVKLQMDHDGQSIDWAPEKGEYVKVIEQHKRFIITGKITLDTINAASQTYYNDIYADTTGQGGGYAGY